MKANHSSMMEYSRTNVVVHSGWRRQIQIAYKLIVCTNADINVLGEPDVADPGLEDV